MLNSILILQPSFSVIFFCSDYDFLTNPFTITTMEIYTIKASRVFHFSTSYTIKASIFFHSRVLCSSLLPVSHLCTQNLRSSSISEKVKTSSVYIRYFTSISDYALLMFGGNLIPSKNGDVIEMLDVYLQFSASKSVLGLIKIC
ncbi:hypothetical protein Hanom_Chr09g00857661 [Helianthus anomalus]